MIVISTLLEIKEADFWADICSEKQSSEFKILE